MTIRNCKWRPMRSRGNYLEALEPRIALAADPVISEFVASNQGGLRDGFDKSPDWIEIWNRGDESVNLEGYTLSDDSALPNKWTFPSVEIAASEYLVVFASGAGAPQSDPAGNLHADFRLARRGGVIDLRSPSGELVSNFGTTEVPYPEQLANVSYGLAQNETVGYFAEPSPGAANAAEALVDFVRDTKFSVNRGFFEESFPLEISTETTDATIYYTLDGSEPTPLTGTVYDGPLTISATTVVRAMADRDGYLPTNIDTNTYFFLLGVSLQDGAGLPATWGTFPFGSSEAPQGSDVPANYDVDQRVSMDIRYRANFTSDLRSLPTISLVVPPDELWDQESGIYSNPLESGVEWERGGSIELIDGDGNTEFQIDAGIRMHGGFGRRPSATAKHSFRLFFKGEYGASKLEHPWFGEDEVSEFDTIVLRAHYNYSWARGDRGGQQTGADYTMLNDRWSNLAQQEMGGLAPNGAYAHLYVNGLYWGVYNPTERPDASFQASHRGGDETDYDVMNHDGLVDGDRVAWSALRRTVRQSPLDFAEVESQLDIDNFIDYMILNQFGGNGDWPGNNWYASRRRADGEQWQFHAWDSEFFFVDANSNQIQNLPRQGPGEIYMELLESDEFKARFADRIQKQMFNGGVLTLDRNIQRMDDIAEVIDRAMVGESARWGDAWMNQRETPRTPDDDWLPRLAELRNDYFPARHDTVIGQYQRRGLFPETLAPTLTPFGGEISSDSTITLGNTNNDGVIYYTLDGSDPRNPDGTVAAGAIEWRGGEIADVGNTTVIARVWTDAEWSPRIEAEFTLLVPGDANNDQVVDHRDLDYVCQLISADEFDPRADLNSDEQVDVEDRDALRTILGTPIGDANGDGEFNSTDLIAIFASGQYEDDLVANSVWSTGDWNCDGEFDSGDLVTAFAAGTYMG